MDAIDEILLTWHRWASGYRPCTGYHLSQTFRSVRSSRQWMDHDDRDAEIDRHVMRAIGEIVDPIVSALSLPHRIAVNSCVQALSASRSHQDIPRRHQRQETAYEAAKAVLRPRLILAGLIEKSERSVDISAISR